MEGAPAARGFTGGFTNALMEKDLALAMQVAICLALQVLFRCEVGDFPAGSYNASVFLPSGRAIANEVGGGILARDAKGTP